MAMREILPGIFHWTARHEKIRILVHSYYVLGARVLIDPMLPPEGLEWLRAHGPPERILLTNRHHYRHSERFVKEFGTSVHCHRAGLHEFTRGEAVEGFEHGDEPARGVKAVEVGALCPEETALHIERSGALALGDAVIRDDGELAFVPDKYMGDDPAGVKRGLRQALRRLLDLPFEHLLLAHGEPSVGDGKKALAKFVGGSD